MGFKNPLTSATVVDTGDGAPAGVRIYQSTDGRGNPQGVIELDDGVAGDAPSTITVTSFGGLGGGSLAIKTGTFGGVAGPELDLYVDQGSGLATASLTAAGGMLLNGESIPAAAPAAFNLPRSGNTTHASDPLGATGAMNFAMGGTINGAAPGDYLIVVTADLFAAAATTAFMRVSVNGANVSADMRIDLTTSPDPKVFAYALAGFPGGALPISVAVQSTSATATILTSGSNIAVAYLGPRT